jgi:branched-chain amino acid transport system substrate-binding protein
VVLAPEEVEGLVVIYPYFQELENAVNREWVRRWHQRFGANYAYITDSACTVWNGWHLWAMAVTKAGSLERDAVIKALESGLTFRSPEGDITLNPESHHVVHTVHLAKVNKQRGFSIIKTFPNVPPTDTMEVCDLIKNPNQAKQYTPKF